MKSIILDLPPVINQTYKSGGRRFYKSSEATKWLRDAQFVVKSQYREKSIKGAVNVDLFFYLTRDADIDSRIKATLDALGGIVYENDSQIQALCVYKYKNRKKAYVEIRWLERN